MKFPYRVEFSGVRFKGAKPKVVEREFKISAESHVVAQNRVREKVVTDRVLNALLFPTYRTTCLEA